MQTKHFIPLSISCLSLLFCASPAVAAGSDTPFVLTPTVTSIDNTNSKQELVFNFSQEPDMARLTKLTPATITPPIDGIWMMPSSTQLKFIPAQTWAPCTKYQFVINKDITSKINNQKISTYGFALETTSLQLENATISSDPVCIHLSFNNYVVPADLKKCMKITDEKGNPVPWEFRKTIITKNPVAWLTAPEKSRFYTCTISKDLKPAQGTLGLKEAISKQVAIVETFEPQEVKGEWSGTASGVINIRMSTYCNGTKNVENFIAIEPKVDFIATCDNQYIILKGNFTENTPYSVTIKKGLVTEYRNFSQTTQEDKKFDLIFPAKPITIEASRGNGWLSQKGTMKLPVTTSGLPDQEIKVEAIRVFDNNYALMAMECDAYGEKDSITRWGDKCSEKNFPCVNGKAIIDLRELIGEDKAGVYLLDISTTKPEGAMGYSYDPENDKNSFYESSNQISTNIFVGLTDLSIMTKYGKDKMTVWVGELHSTKPVKGAAVSVYSKTNQIVKEGVTDENGLVTLTGLPQTAKLAPFIVLAKKDKDLSYLKLDKTQSWNEAFPGTGDDFIADKAYNAYVTTERGAYRPGETIHLLALVRDKYGNAPKEQFPVTVQIKKPNAYAQQSLGTLMTDASGHIETSWTLAADIPTGYYTFTFEMPGNAINDVKSNGGASQYLFPSSARIPLSIGILGETSVYVGEFMPDRIRVKSVLPTERVATGTTITNTIKAEEMFGNPAAGRSAHANIDYKYEPYTSKKFEDYVFGDAFQDWSGTSKYFDIQNLDDGGSATFDIPYPEKGPSGPIKATVQSTVYDSGRGVTDSGDIIIDTAPYYIGLKAENDGFIETGKDCKINVVAIDPKTDEVAPAAANASFDLALLREQWNSTLVRDGASFKYESKLELIPVTTGTLTFDAEGKTTWQFNTRESGVYRVKATNSSHAYTVLQLTVSSGSWNTMQPWMMEKPENLEVSLDQKEYTPGSQARLLIKAPFTGTAIVGFEQDDPLDVMVLPMESNTLETTFTIKEEYAPKTWVSVTVLRPVTPEGKWMPHRAVGFAPIQIAPKTRELSVTLDLPESVKPNDDLKFSAVVKNAATDQPVADANVQIWGVDEGLLTLTDFSLKSPMEWLFRNYRLMVDTCDFYSDLVPDLLENVLNKTTTGGDGDTGRKIRSSNTKRVKSVVYWLGQYKTDAAGRVEGSLKTPISFNGSLMMMALADNATLMGSASKAVAIKAPLIVQNNAPRFMAMGDTAELSYTVFNTTTEPLAAKLHLTAGDLLTLDKTTLDTPVIQPNSSTVIKLTMNAAKDKIGTCLIKCDGTMGTYTALDEVELAVRPASPNVTWSRLLPIASDTKWSRIPICPWGTLVPGTFRFNLTASDFGPIQLQNALRYNLEYPYGCLEQTVSRALPFLALEQADLCEKLGYNRQYVRELVQKAINRLPLFQSYDNDLRLWIGSSSTDPFTSAYTLFFLCEARDSGYKVPQSLINMLSTTLLNSFEFNSSDLSGTAKALAYYTLVRANKVVARDVMLKVYNMRDTLTPSGKAWLAAGLFAEGQTNLAKPILDAAVDAVAAPDYKAQPNATGQDPYETPDREGAVVLWAFADSQTSDTAKSDLLALRLEQSMQDGKWANTQSNAWAIMALAKLQKQRGPQEPHDYKITLKIGDKDYSFDPKTSVTLDEKTLTDQDVLSVEFTGKGKAAVAWYGSGVPITPPRATSNGGLAITREYCNQDGSAADLNKIKQGDLITVKIKVKSPQDIKNVILQDLLPAGLEIENGELATSFKKEQEETDTFWYSKSSESLDDRYLAFGDLNATNENKSAVIMYQARAVTPGTFVIPPAQVEGMYNPSAFVARTDKGTMTIKAR